MKTLHEKLFNYFLVSPTRIDIGSTYFHSWQQIKDHVVLNKKPIWEIYLFLFGDPDKD